jgi:hypothetical protein
VAGGPEGLTNLSFTAEKSKSAGVIKMQVFLKKHTGELG